MTNCTIRINGALVVICAIAVGAALISYGEKRQIRKELEKQVKQNEGNISFIFRKLKELEGKGDH